MLERVGAGGMGTVYRAMHVDLDREVAIKVLPPEMNNNPTMVARFKREAKAAAQLQHENIVQIYDVQEDKGRAFLALEFIRGKDLSDLITEKKFLPIKQAIDILRQATRALEHAFQKGIVHRDIKPSNFLITKDGKVKLCDMGLALRTDAGEEAKVTRDGTTVGTVDYMSPEQARDSRYADTRSDIYSLGCTLYQMLTGRVPFEEGSIPEKLFKHATEPPPDPLQYNSEIPPAIVYILNKMLEKKADDRYQTPKSLLEDLETLNVDDAAKQQDENRKTLAIGIEEDETDAEQVVLQRPSAKKQQEGAKKAAETQQKKKQQQLVMIGGGAVAAVVVILVALVGWLTLGRGKPEKLPDDPSKTTAKVDPPKTSGDPSKTTTKTGGPETTSTGSSNSSSNSTTNNAASKPSGSEPMTKTEIDPATKTSDTNTTTSETTPAETTTKPVAPKLSDEERKRLKQDLFPDWPTTAIPGDLTRVARGAQQETGGVLASLEAACRKAKSGSSKIQIEDNGPLFERGFQVQQANLEIRPRIGEKGQYMFRPIVAYDAAADKANPKSSLVEARNSNLVIEGIDFVVNAADFRESLGVKPFTFFDIQGGDLVLKNCTFTILGNHSEVSIVRFGGVRAEDAARTPAKLARLTIDGCFARGEPLTAVSLTSPIADVKIVDSLFVAGPSNVLIDLKQSLDKEAQSERTLRLIRSTFVTRGDFLSLDGTGGAIPASLKFVDTIVACSTPGSARKLVRTRSWPEKDGMLSSAKMDERSALYLGWESLVFGGVGKLSATTTEEWQKIWRIEVPDHQVRRESWPAASDEVSDPAKAPSAAYDATEVAAGIPSRLDEEHIGCLVERLSPQAAMILERTYSRMQPAGLVGLERLLPSFTYNPQKNQQLGAWQGDQNRRKNLPGAPVKGDEPDPVLELTFNVNQGGDLGKFLMNPPQPLQETTIVVVTGSGVQSISPVKLTGKKSLVIWVQQVANQPPLTFAPAAGDDATEALFDVRDGDLTIEGANFAWPQNAPPRTPKRFIQVERGNLTLSGCKLSGPLQGDTNFEAISFAGGPQQPRQARQAGDRGVHIDFHPAPHPTVNVCQLVDCYVGAEARCVRFTGSQGVLRFSNCLAVSAGTIASLEELGESGAKAFEDAVVVEQSTLAASRSFFEIGEWLSQTLPARPLIVTSRDSLYADPFDVLSGAAAKNRTSVLLRYNGRTLQQGILQWESSNDAYAHELHSFLLHKDSATGQRQKFDQDWLAVWGRVHVTDAIIDPTRVEKIRFKEIEPSKKDSAPKLRDFERDKKFSVLELDSRCDAAKKSVGVDLKRLLALPTN